jgi:hypothetical protein
VGKKTKPEVSFALPSPTFLKITSADLGEYKAWMLGPSLYRRTEAAFSPSGQQPLSEPAFRPWPNAPD